MEYRKERREKMIKEKIREIQEDYRKKHPETYDEQDAEVILNIPKDF